MTLIGQKWKELTEEGKIKYQEMAKEDQVRVQAKKEADAKNEVK